MSERRRKAIPAMVKLEVALRAQGLTIKRVQFDHQPPLELRPLNAEGTDTVPPANDPGHITLLTIEQHAEKTWPTKRIEVEPIAAALVLPPPKPKPGDGPWPINAAAEFTLQDRSEGISAQSLPLLSETGSSIAALTIPRRKRSGTQSGQKKWKRSGPLKGPPSPNASGSMTCTPPALPPSEPSPLGTTTRAHWLMMCWPSLPSLSHPPPATPDRRPT